MTVEIRYRLLDDDFRTFVFNDGNAPAESRSAADVERVISDAWAAFRLQVEPQITAVEVRP